MAPKNLDCPTKTGLLLSSLLICTSVARPNPRLSNSFRRYQVLKELQKRRDFLGISDFRVGTFPKLLYIYQVIFGMPKYGRLGGVPYSKK